MRAQHGDHNSAADATVKQGFPEFNRCEGAGLESKRICDYKTW